MFRIKVLKCICLLLLIGGSFARAQAQTAGDFDPSSEGAQPVLSGTYYIGVEAIETFPGETVFNEAKTFDRTSHGTTEGDLSGFIFISLNYTLPENNTVGDVSREESLITSGSWAKLIFKEGVYRGSVFGKITVGKILWNRRTNTASITFELKSDSGTGIFTEERGKGFFEGTLYQSTKAPTLKGRLTLEY